MAKITRFKCDSCGNESELFKGWFSVAMPIFDADNNSIVGTFAASAVYEENCKHVCGQTCLQKAVCDYADIVTAQLNPPQPIVEREI